jgi:ABC-2 type transport system permease protein
MIHAAEARGLVVTAVLIRRELVRFVRQPARIVAAIGTACVLWLFLASGFAEALRPQHLGETSYATFLLPGMMTLVAVFAAVFSSMSIIEDRNDGWLATVLVSPVPRWAIALGRITGAAIVAWSQGALLLLLAPLLDVSLTLPSAVVALAGLAVTSLGMTAVGCGCCPARSSPCRARRRGWPASPASTPSRGARNPSAAPWPERHGPGP